MAVGYGVGKGDGSVVGRAVGVPVGMGLGYRSFADEVEGEREMRFCGDSKLKGGLQF